MIPGRRATNLARGRRRSRVQLTVAVLVATGSVAGFSVLSKQDPEREAVGNTATSASVATTTVSIATTTTVPKTKRFSIVVSGDILLHMPLNDRAASYAAESGSGVRDFRPMFSRVKHLLTAADLALCHLETTLSPDGNNLSGYPNFSAAPEIAAAISEAGFDGCSTASNHSYDNGDSGVIATLDHFDKIGLGHAGTARSNNEAKKTRMYGVSGVKVAHLAYTSFLNGGHPSDPWMINLATMDRVAEIKADAKRARQDGADFVIVSVHWGNEFQLASSRTQIDLADAITAIDAVDVVVGHHAHVVQAIEKRNGKWVVFGLGNFLSNQRLTECCPAESQDGIIVRIRVEETDSGFEVTHVDYTPTLVERETYTIIPVSVAAQNPRNSDAARNEYVRSAERTLSAVTSTGTTLTEIPLRTVVSNNN